MCDTARSRWAAKEGVGFCTVSIDYLCASPRSSYSAPLMSWKREWERERGGKERRSKTFPHDWFAGYAFRPSFDIYVNITVHSWNWFVQAGDVARNCFAFTIVTWSDYFANRVVQESTLWGLKHWTNADTLAIVSCTRVLSAIRLNTHTHQREPFRWIKRDWS